jgi:PTS system maltose and glucose-specific IIC component
MIFGTGERLLLPFGLQHILVALIRFTEAGGTMEVCGHDVSGALTIFQAQLSCPTTHGFSESATRFLSQGKMPAFLGGCRVPRWRCTTARARKTVIKLKAC